MNRIKTQQRTAVWQNGGVSAKLKFSFQKKLSAKKEVSASKSATSPSGDPLPVIV